ncbi:MAG: hypothetical protein Q7R56_03590 [Nanoarchaeota archaeon]|nr:hypothetical protein [Nanoarchaeota archaeon]
MNNKGQEIGWPLFVVLSMLAALIIGYELYNVVTSLPKQERLAIKKEAYLLATYLQLAPQLKAHGDISIAHTINPQFDYTIQPGIIITSTHDKKITLYTPYTYPTPPLPIIQEGEQIIIP